MRRLLVVIAVLCLSTTPLFSIDAVFVKHDAPAGPDYQLMDFYVYPYNDSYYQAFARITYQGTQWRQYVKVTAVLFSAGKMVTSQQSYLDFSTFGKYGMWPGSESYTHMFIDRVEFDSVLFSVSYTSVPLGVKFNRHALAVISSVYDPYYKDTYKFSGLVQNMTGVAIDHPMIFAMAYQGGRLAAFNYAYPDAPDYILGPAQLAAFELYLEMPAGFDSVAYLTNYGLTATGDITMTGTRQPAREMRQPVNFSLSPNYPNPFNASTTFTIWMDQPQEAKLQVFDLSGRALMTVFSGLLPAGESRIRADAGSLPSGSYLAVLSGEADMVVMKILLVK